MKTLLVEPLRGGGRTSLIRMAWRFASDVGSTAVRGVVRQRERGSWLWTLPLVITATAGCNAILGVDEARYDPNLDPLVASGGSGGSAAGGAAGAAGNEDPTCVAYCDLVELNCKGELQEYPSRDTCLNMCRRMDNGPANAVTGNTIECRTTHAGLAVTEPDKAVEHCLAAGPLGNGTCGDICGAFCALNLAYCVAPRVDVPAYGSPSECLTACNAMPFEKLSQSAYFAGSDKDNLNCRDYHLQAAYRSDGAAVTHCSHTALSSSTCF